MNEAHTAIDVLENFNKKVEKPLLNKAKALKELFPWDILALIASVITLVCVCIFVVSPIVPHKEAIVGQWYGAMLAYGEDSIELRSGFSAKFDPDGTAYVTFPGGEQKTYSWVAEANEDSTSSKDQQYLYYQLYDGTHTSILFSIDTNPENFYPGQLVITPDETEPLNSFDQEQVYSFWKDTSQTAPYEKFFQFFN